MEFVPLERLQDTGLGKALRTTCCCPCSRATLSTTQVKSKREAEANIAWSQ